jgi:hypothetical protein
MRGGRAVTDPMELMRAALESPWKTAQLAAVARLDSDAALLAVLNASSNGTYTRPSLAGCAGRRR